MTSAQRIIKYIAMGFALLLAVSIIGGIGATIFGITKKYDKSKDSTEVVSEKYELDPFESIRVDADLVDISIQQGNEYAVELIDVPKEIEVEVESDDTLTITMKDDDDWLKWFGANWDVDSKVIITVPTDYKAKNLEIYAGAAEVKMNKIATEKLYIEGGVGDIDITEITADEVELEAGVGDFELKKVDFGACKVDVGVGNVEIDGKILGDCEFNAGIGNLDVIIDGTKDDFDFSIDGGIGSIYINGESMHDCEENNNNEYDFSIDGGVGDVNVKFTQD